ncbi:hypothetical protein BDV11DRAFT_169190 [Aspergillus similis]
MSDRVPAMTSPEHFPYCFWYPGVPPEETLRQLLTQYQGNTLLRYQVGRACAVGGYTTLYHGLRLLPEVAIAEEACDNFKSGHAINEAIMKAPVRYAYMDDYSHCLRAQPLAALSEYELCPFISEVVFNITEDRCIDIVGIKPLARPVDPQAIVLLYTSLPADLPTVDKELLILMVDDSDLPDLIWYPQVAHEVTYRELVRRRPSMIPTVTRARIHADYKDLVAILDVIPDDAELVMDARKSRNKCYEECLQHKASERGIDLKQVLEYEEDWTGKKPHVMLDQDRIERGYGSQAMWLDRELTLDHVGFQPEELATVSSSIGRVLFHASVAGPSMRPSPPYTMLDLVELYEEARMEERNTVGLQPRTGLLRRGRGRGY